MYLIIFFIVLFLTHDLFISFYLLQNKRDALSRSNIRGPFNANPMSRFVELVLVADKAEFEKQGSDVSKIHNRFKTIANIMNAVNLCLLIFFCAICTGLPLVLLFYFF